MNLETHLKYLEACLLRLSIDNMLHNMGYIDTDKHTEQVASTLQHMQMECDQTQESEQEKCYQYIRDRSLTYNPTIQNQCRKILPARVNNTLLQK